MNILYIAGATPYDTVAHAGGQTLNYYIKSIAKEKDIRVHLVAYALEKDIRKSDLERYNITPHYVFRKNDFKKVIGNIYSVNSIINPWHKYCHIMTTYASNLLLRKLYDVRKEFEPDVIILEWTQIILQIDKIRRIFPNAKYIASEHDVTFLGAERKADFEKNKLYRIYKKCIAYTTKKYEIKSLNACNIIFAHNEKDKELLISNGLDKNKVDSLVAFYHKSAKERECKNNDIIFYGNMNRQENIQAVEWFSEYVMPLISTSGCKFVVVGGGDIDFLKKKYSNVVFTGYVESIDKIFSEALCFVAPLQLGAGIKVKILEALYSGIPVLTNAIGIEGIPAKNGIDYMYCDTAHDYAAYIMKLYNRQVKPVYGKDFMEDNFSIIKGYEHYVRRIKDIHKNEN